MLWPLITTLYASILLFISIAGKLANFKSNYITTQQLAILCRWIGLVSITFAGLLWSTQYGWQDGLLFFAIATVGSFSLLYLSRPKLNKLVASSALIIAANFIFSTVKIITVVV